MNLHIIDAHYIWVMDSEYCGNCGTALGQFETDLCYDCQQDVWFDEDQDFYDGWFGDIEDVPCPGPIPEQYVPITWRNIVQWVGIWLLVLLLSIGLIALAYVTAIEKIQAR